MSLCVSEVSILFNSRRDRTDSILLGCLVALLILFWILYLNREFLRAKLRWVLSNPHSQFLSNIVKCSSLQLHQAVSGWPVSLWRPGGWWAGAGLWRNPVGGEESLQEEDDDGECFTSSTLRASSSILRGRQQWTGIPLFSCDSLA